MQTNHLSHFLLTKELLPLLKTGARVVHHSSIARLGPPLEAKYLEKRGGDLGGNKNGWLIGTGPKWDRYHQSKLANSVMTLALAERINSSAKNSGIVAACAAPGYAATNLQDTSVGMGGAMWTKMFRQSAEDGTMPLLTCCFGPNVANGDFFEPESGGGMWGKAIKKNLEKESTDPEAQKMLWEKSEEACGKFDL